MRNQNAFTLIELLIVVIILGILAAVVIPQFQDATTEAKESVLMNHLSTFRSAIELYNAEHRSTYPGIIGGASSWANFETHMTTQTDADGNPGVDFGPYMRNGIPRNPINNLADGIEGPIPGAPDDTTGWLYDSTTGEIRANSSGAGPSTGVDYFDM
jgi:general secretion pathway protein G